MAKLCYYSVVPRWKIYFTNVFTYTCSCLSQYTSVQKPKFLKQVMGLVSKLRITRIIAPYFERPTLHFLQVSILMPYTYFKPKFFFYYFITYNSYKSSFCIVLEFHPIETSGSNYSIQVCWLINQDNDYIYKYIATLGSIISIRVWLTKPNNNYNSFKVQYFV